MHCLVEWEEESSSSIVPLKAVVGDKLPTTDERRQVRWSRAVYWAKCVGTGECMTLVIVCTLTMHNILHVHASISHY